MKLFENIKEFFFAAEDDDFDADVPVRHERGVSAVSHLPIRTMLP